MRPLKSLSVLAKWLLRLSLVAIIYSTSFDPFISFSFSGLNYFIHLLLILFGILLFIGPFSKKQTLTVLSALFICILFLMLLLRSSGSVENIITYTSYIVISFYFLTTGNK